MEVRPMDLTERIGGIALDNGSSSLEFLLLAVPFAGVGYLRLRTSERRNL